MLYMANLEDSIYDNIEDYLRSIRINLGERANAR